VKRSGFATYAWSVLAYNLLVILWGAFVRATGSGAGCGNHWPLCNGELAPRTLALETLIEYSHRVTSGIALLLTAGLLVWALRRYARGHIVRTSAVLSMFFLIVEALIGAGLVLFEYVATNTSLARAYWMAGHLANTFFLLASLTLTAWWAMGAPKGGHRWGALLRVRGQGPAPLLLGLAWAGMILLGSSGGVTALGDTLVLTAGITPAESAVVALLVDLRIYHPLLALATGALVGLAAWVAMTKRPGALTRRFGRWVVALFVVQLLLGALNVALKAPVWIQLSHLLLADLIWITLVLLSAATFAGAPQPDADWAAAEADVAVSEL
jgi:heme A synthase